MKIPIVGLLTKVLDLFSKRSKNGEKTQELEALKVDVYKEALVNILYVLIILIVINTLFPQLQISEWIYNLADRIITYMMAQ